TGAALAESPPAALAIAAMTAALLVARRFDPDAGRGRLPPVRVVVAAGALGLGVAALLTAPLLLRAHAPRAWVDVGHAISAASLSALDTAGARTTALAAWIKE